MRIQPRLRFLLSTPGLSLWSALLIAPLVSPVWAGPSVQSDKLEQALDAITVQNARSDLYFLASDELGGRDTPSPGQRIAARFISARMERLGFTPSGDRGFFADYQLIRAGLDADASHASVEMMGEVSTLALSTDYYIGTSGVDELDLSGNVIFVGTCAPSDLEDLDLTGKWALCLSSKEISWRDRVAAAKSVGAIGLLCLPGTERDARRFDSNAARYLRRTQAGGLHLRKPVWPVSYLSPALGPKLLPAGTETASGTELAFRWSEQRRIKEDSEVSDLENVAALWPGSDPEIGKEVIIISAHYDHIGMHDGDIYNGADDNGSGTTGMLQIAEALKVYGPMRRSILLLWVSGEEKGLLGSEAWTKRPTLPDGYVPVCNLNIDMIGRNAPDYLLITPTKDRPEYNGIVSRFEKFAPLEGFPSLGNADEYYFRSDQVNFSKNLGIPVAFLFSDVHEDYHQPTDTPDKIDYDKLCRVTRLVVRMMASLQDDELGV